MEDLPYLVALHSVDGFGSVRLRSILQYFENAKNAWDSNPQELRKLSIPAPTVKLFSKLQKERNPQEYLESIFNRGVKVISLFDNDYPPLLKEIYDPPIILFFSGDSAVFSTPAVGIVGSRKVTGYGKIVTEKFAGELSDAGLTVVSGLAQGVDTIAHSTTVEHKGKTIAVLAGGLNKIFPATNTDLARKIATSGGAVISEFPLDYPHLAGNFPARNRIISGISKGVLVTEATVDSGSLITARLALEQGREVFAVPGPITSPLSSGPAHLIREGATLVTESKHILESLGINRVMSAELRVKNLEGLSVDEKAILNELESEQKHIDELARALKKSVALVSASLLKMEVKGIVKNLGAGSYSRTI